MNDHLKERVRTEILNCIKTSDGVKSSYLINYIIGKWHDLQRSEINELLNELVVEAEVRALNYEYDNHAMRMYFPANCVLGIV